MNLSTGSAIAGDRLRPRDVGDLDPGERRGAHRGDEGEVGVLDAARGLDDGEIGLGARLPRLGHLNHGADPLRVARFGRGLHGVGVFQGIGCGRLARPRGRMGVERQARVVDELLVRRREGDVGDDGDLLGGVDYSAALPEIEEQPLHGHGPDPAAGRAVSEQGLARRGIVAVAPLVAADRGRRDLGQVGAFGDARRERRPPCIVPGDPRSGIGRLRQIDQFGQRIDLVVVDCRRRGQDAEGRVRRNDIALCAAVPAGPRDDVPIGGHGRAPRPVGPVGRQLQRRAGATPSKSTAPAARTGLGDRIIRLLL